MLVRLAVSSCDEFGARSLGLAPAEEFVHAFSDGSVSVISAKLDSSLLASDFANRCTTYRHTFFHLGRCKQASIQEGMESSSPLDWLEGFTSID